MAAVIAVRLRDVARACMLACGGRGFMRFFSEGGALLVTDAYGRCGDDAARASLTGALESAGFCCRSEGNLLLLTPGDALLSVLCAEETRSSIDWSSPLYPMQALCARWQAAPDVPLTDAGRQLVIDTLRMTWQGRESALNALGTLRAQAAVMLRAGDKSGMRMAAAILDDCCRNG